MDYNLPKTIQNEAFSTKSHGLGPTQTTQNEAFSAQSHYITQTTQNEAFNQKLWTKLKAFSTKHHGLRLLTQTIQNEASKTYIVKVPNC